MATKRPNRTFEQRLTAIEARNARVEKNKAWEMSLTRRLSICILTYITASAVLYMLFVPDWYLGAIVPVCGYILSTLSIPIIRRWWEKSR